MKKRNCFLLLLVLLVPIVFVPQAAAAKREPCRNLPTFIQDTHASLPKDHQVPCGQITLITNDGEFASDHPGQAFQQVLRDDTVAFVIVGIQKIYVRQGSAVFQATKALYGYNPRTTTQDTDIQRDLLRALWLQILYEEAEHLAGNHSELSACIKGLEIAKTAWSVKYGPGWADDFFNKQKQRCESRNQTVASR